MTITTAVPIIKVAPYAPLTLLSCTSNSSVTVLMGPCTFTMNEANVGFTVGMRVHAVNPAFPANWVEGYITARDANDITVNVDLLAGSGTFTTWNLNQTGQPGLTGPQGPQGPQGTPGNPSDIVQTVLKPLRLNGTQLVMDYDTTLTVNLTDQLGIIANVVLPGAPTTTTPATNDNSTKIATTQFTQAAIVAVAAPINSPALTGTPTAPTPSVGSNDQSIATTAFVHNVALIYQPLDADLTSLAAAASTAMYYRKDTSSNWAPVVIGSGLGFDLPTGTLSASGSPTGGIPEAPNDGTQYGRRNAGWFASAVQTDAPADGNYYSRRNNAWILSIQSGGTMNGNLTIQSANPSLTLATGATGVGSLIGTGTTGARWSVVLDDGSAETGGNTGSNFAINRYNDAGTLIDAPISIVRGSGQVTMSNVNLTGTPKAPTPATASNDTSIATTAYVKTQGPYLPLAGGAVTGPVSIAGNLSVTGTITGTMSGYLPSAGGTLSGALTISAGGLNVTGAHTQNGTMTVTGNIAQAAGYNTSVPSLRVAGQTSAVAAGVDQDAGGAYFSFAAGSGWMWEYSRPSGDVFLIQGNQIRVYPRYADAAFIVYGPPYVPGGGMWNDLNSDSRVKDILGEYKSGLTALKTISPIRYICKGNARDEGPESKIPSPHYKAAEDGREFIGITAQQAEQAFPEMVTKRKGFIDGKPVDDLRGLNATALVYALINAVKELSERIEALEAK